MHSASPRLAVEYRGFNPAAGHQTERTFVAIARAGHVVFDEREAKDLARKQLTRRRPDFEPSIRPMRSWLKQTSQLD
jgi:hypothetical protein